MADNYLFKNWPAALTLPFVYGFLHCLMIKMRLLQFVTHHFFDLHAVKRNHMLIQSIFIHIRGQWGVWYGWLRSLKHFRPATDMMLIYVFHGIVGQLWMSSQEISRKDKVELALSMVLSTMEKNSKVVPKNEVTTCPMLRSVLLDSST
jgi:hypothetical protein